MIEAIKINDIPKRNIRYLEVQRDIEEFLAKNCEVAEVKLPETRRSASVYASYRKQIVLNNYAVKVIQRNGRVFLIRKDVDF